MSAELGFGSTYRQQAWTDNEVNCNNLTRSEYGGHEICSRLKPTSLTRFILCIVTVFGDCLTMSSVVGNFRCYDQQARLPIFPTTASPKNTQICADRVRERIDFLGIFVGFLKFGFGV